MKRFLLLLLAATFTLILIVSTSESMMRKVAQFRFDTRSILHSPKYSYGDLYGLSYLPDFKITPNFTSSDVKLDPCNANRLTNLYVAGDSYLGKNFLKGESLLCGVKNYYYIQHNAGDTMTVKLAPVERNVLLIESVERNLKAFADTNYIIDKLLMRKKKEAPREMNLEELSLMVKRALYNPNLEQNIEFNLFDYNLFIPIKEAKANFNYVFFHRLPDEVSISPDKKYLLHKSTTDTLSYNSSFTPVSDSEINAIVGSLNYLQDYYKLKGFDEVYFTIAPNPVTIMYPNVARYNEMIPRIQNSPDLRIPLIDVYDLFRKTKYPIYFKTDTHWNLNGFHLWLNEFNRVLLQNGKNQPSRNSDS